jgi:Na+-transporting NADH:ubiquinone oxidoreductase subunit NqrA
VAFGNVGGAGFGGPGAAVSVNTVSGSDLRMTRDGEIAVGDWSTTVLSGANVGGGSSQQSQPLIGRYHLDGHLIAIQRRDGTITRGFIAGVNEKGALGHVYLNGRHFWNRND